MMLGCEEGAKRGQGEFSLRMRLGWVRKLGVQMEASDGCNIGCESDMWLSRRGLIKTTHNSQALLRGCLGVSII